MRELSAVALGGGHGLYTTLTALRRITDDITAIVTVADDGGSSGRLRRDRGLLPPGDLRQALAALSGTNGDQLWSRVLQYRFGGDGDLAGHPVGNLLLAGLFEVLGDPVAALAEAGKAVGLSGRVLPMSPDPLDIEAAVAGLNPDGSLRSVRGQVAVAATTGQVRRVNLRRAMESDGMPVACPEAVEAVRDADAVFLGPGSWFTSVLPHLLLPELADALMHTSARKIVVLNLIPQPGETTGFSPEQHLDVLCEHAPGLRIDAVIADSGSVAEHARLRSAAAGLGARAYLARVADRDVVGRHDPDALAHCVREALHLSGGRTSRPD